MFCFFKQKTAYEMRISDWSSDVCSSDLMLRGAMAEDRRAVDDAGEGFEESRRADQRERRRIALPGFADRPCRSLVHQEAAAMVKGSSPASRVRTGTSGIRSEEHTSELPSLMRTPYSVFCLKKKQNTQH